MGQRAANALVKTGDCLSQSRYCRAAAAFAKVFVFSSVSWNFLLEAHTVAFLIPPVKSNGGLFLLWPQVEVADSLDSLVSGFSNWTNVARSGPFSLKQAE